MNETYDLIVIGSGSVGASAAKQGLKVLTIDAN